ncbi:hypothetical protein Ancab_032700 [Ancistrocladus abbreviatus]
MAAAAATHLKIQAQPTKAKRRRCREITISSSATSTTISAAAAIASLDSSPGRFTKNLQSPVFSPDNSLKLPTATATINPPTPPAFNSNLPAYPDPDPESDPNATRSVKTTNPYSSQSNLTIQFSPNRPLSLSPYMDYALPSSFSKFNSALTAGLLNPMSPPPQTPPATPPMDKATRSSPTLFEMMANESDSFHPKGTAAAAAAAAAADTQSFSQHAVVSSMKGSALSAQERQYLKQLRISEILGRRSPGNLFNDPNSSDIKLTLSAKDGFSVSVNVHKEILVGHSRFFAGRLSSEKWTKDQRLGAPPPPYEVELAECDDVEVYIETLRLMYCKDLRRRLMKEDVPKVLGVLKVSAAIGFDAGVLSCLEYLEAAPWAEDEEEKVALLLSELRLEGLGAREVLKRVSLDVPAATEEKVKENEEVLMKLVSVVLEGKDEKARREMKGLVSKMLRENANQNDLRKESIYSSFDGCLQQLRHHFLQAAASDLQDVGQIARQADNLHWILDILIDRQIAEEFLKAWASQTEMSVAHSKVPPVHRFEVSRVTARLFVGIGKGHLLASKETRCSLLQTWLVPFYDDFGWMKRASKGLDSHLIEDCLSNTILTLPLSWQQEILLAWFERFLNSREDCPNIQRGFEVWWRRAFWRRNGELERSRVRILSAENS